MQPACQPHALKQNIEQTRGRAHHPHNSICTAALLQHVGATVGGLVHACTHAPAMMGPAGASTEGAANKLTASLAGAVCVGTRSRKVLLLNTGVRLARAVSVRQACMQGPTGSWEVLSGKIQPLQPSKHRDCAIYSRTASAGSAAGPCCCAVAAVAPVSRS